MISLFETTEAEVAFDEAVLEAETDEFVFANESAQMFNEADEAGKASVWAKLKQWIKDMGEKLKNMLVKIGDFFKTSYNKSKELLNKINPFKNDKTVAEVEIIPDEDVEILSISEATEGPKKASVGSKAKKAVKVSWNWVIARLKSFGKMINKINPFKKNADKGVKDAQSSANKEGKDGKQPGKIKSLVTSAMGKLSKAVKTVKNWIKNTFKAVTALFHKKNTAEKASKDENR